MTRMKLVKHRTEDGTDFVKESVPLGKEYMVDLNSKCIRTWGSWNSDKTWMRESVIVKSDDGRSGWMPLELFAPVQPT
jgi:hypothetical protein